MLTIEKAKQQAETLAAYLLNVGKRVKHTHALEAVARMHGHRSWNIFQSAAVQSEKAGSVESAEKAKTHYDLAELFGGDWVDHVLLNGVRYELDYYDSDVLGGYEEIMNGGGDDLQLTAVILQHVGAERIWESLTVERLSQATYLPDGSWRLADGIRMELFSRHRT